MTAESHYWQLIARRTKLAVAHLVWDEHPTPHPRTPLLHLSCISPPLSSLLPPSPFFLFDSSGLAPELNPSCAQKPPVTFHLLQMTPLANSLALAAEEGRAGWRRIDRAGRLERSVGDNVGGGVGWGAEMEGASYWNGNRTSQLEQFTRKVVCRLDSLTLYMQHIMGWWIWIKVNPSIITRPLGLN